VRPEEEIRKHLRLDRFPHLWCPGCSNGIATRAIVAAVLRSGVPLDKVVVVSGIGCSARTSGYLHFDGLHTTHGRALAFATGVKLARPELVVLVITGDGDLAAIGGNHFIHAARRNVDLTLICFNNRIYGMTGGQYSPTTFPGDRATTAPYGHRERAFDLCSLAIAAGATYVARGTAFHVQPLIRYLARAIQHRGLSFVEVMSSCPVYYGRQQKVGGAPELLSLIASQAVPVEEYERLPPEERARKYPVGELHLSEAPELGEELARLAAASRGGGG